MSTVDIPGEVSVPSVTRVFQRGGLALVTAASGVGSGSVFVASSAGDRYDYRLLWAVVGAVRLGFVAPDASARLGVHGESLAAFARKKFGSTRATTVMAPLAVHSAWSDGSPSTPSSPAGSEA